VSRLFPADQLLAEALKLAERIAGLSDVATVMGKQAVNRAFETTLSEGVRAERQLFLSLFGTVDQREGTAAFAEKRKLESSMDHNNSVDYAYEVLTNTCLWGACDGMSSPRRRPSAGGRWRQRGRASFLDSAGAPA
jgi:hypothetical protein